MGRFGLRRAFIATVFATLAFGLGVAPAAFTHPANAPPPPPLPPDDVEPIPSEDLDQYVSRVTAIKPRVPGLKARIVGNQEKLEVTWTGEKWLVVLGYSGEPMVRMSSRGIEINELSPSAFMSGDRYADVVLPGTVDPKAPPQWRPFETAGPIAWYDHRAQWMEPDRPKAVGDGTEGLTIFHWHVPARLRGERVLIRGALDWRPDPAAIRAKRSEVSSPLLSGLILGGTFLVGWFVGVKLRGRHERSGHSAT